MQEALYHPQFGYYTAQIRSLGGRSGDFTTTPELSKLPAQAIAAWVMEEANASTVFQQAKTLHVIEIGCGDGSLAHEIFQSWSWWQRRRIRYHLVEISPVLRSRQQEKLQRQKKRCQWHDSIHSALEAANGQALAFSNELIDAFPVTAIRWDTDEQQWNELHLRFDQKTGLQEVFVPLAKKLSTKQNKHYSILQESTDKLKNGERREFHASARKWLESWADQLRHGSLLTIDYGEQVGSLYHRRPAGTLRAYYQHQHLTGPAIYQRFGRQDLTADVNFTDLENWGQDLDLQPIRLETLDQFIQRHAAPANTKSPLQSLDADRFVMNPIGSGGSFQTLLQRKT